MNAGDLRRLQVSQQDLDAMGESAQLYAEARDRYDRESVRRDLQLPYFIETVMPFTSDGVLARMARMKLATGRK